MNTLEMFLGPGRLFISDVVPPNVIMIGDVDEAILTLGPSTMIEVKRESARLQMARINVAPETKDECNEASKPRRLIRLSK